MWNWRGWRRLELPTSFVAKWLRDDLRVVLVDDVTRLFRAYALGLMAVAFDQDGERAHLVDVFLRRSLEPGDASCSASVGSLGHRLVETGGGGKIVAKPAQERRRLSAVVARRDSIVSQPVGYAHYSFCDAGVGMVAMQNESGVFGLH